MDDPVKWSEGNLKMLIQDEIRENLTLDYKSSGALLAKSESQKKEISKDVSAFANSAGGIIIYGMVEEQHLPKAIDGIDPGAVTREWLDQVISSRIQQRIDNVRINQVLLSDKKVVYVVVVPQSDRAPHMASDHRYYKRFEFRSVPMEDYEVKDVANRAYGPQLKINMWLETKTLVFNEGEEFSQPLQISASVINENVQPANHAVFQLFADARLQGNPNGFSNKQEVMLSIGDAKLISYNFWQKNWGVPGKLPIWNGMSFQIFDGKYEARIPKGAGEYGIGWSVKAPHMTNSTKFAFLKVDKKGCVSLKETEISLNI